MGTMYNIDDIFTSFPTGGGVNLLEDDVGDDVGDEVGDDVSDDVGDGVGDGVGDDVGDDAGDGVGDGAGDDIGDNRGDDVGDDPDKDKEKCRHFVNMVSCNYSVSSESRQARRNKIILVKQSMFLSSLKTLLRHRMF